MKVEAKIRLATEADLADLASLAGLANAGDGMHRATGGLRERLFGENSLCRALVADIGGPIVGVAHFHRFESALAAQPSLWLDDLFVVSDYRSQGIGQQLLTELCRLGAEENCCQIDFTASGLNRRALRFYRRLGAIFFNETRYGRLTDEAMRTVVETPPERRRKLRKRSKDD